MNLIKDCKMDNQQIELTQELLENQDNYIEKFVSSLDIILSESVKDIESDEEQDVVLGLLRAAKETIVVLKKMGYEADSTDDFIVILDKHADLLLEKNAPDHICKSFKNNRDFLFSMKELEDKNQNNPGMDVKTLRSIIGKMVVDHNQHTGKKLVFDS